MEGTRYAWSRLNPLQLGRWAEHFVKMEFALLGFEVYTSDVDDRGIDFVLRKDRSRFYEIQVKGVRSLDSAVFFQKDKFPIEDTFFAAVVILCEGKSPELYLIPSTAWATSSPLFANRDYEGRKSKPEWGLNLSRRNQELLNEFAFEKVVSKL